MPNKENILKYNHSQKSVKVPFVIYVDFETILGKTSTCDDVPEASYTAEVNKPTAYGFLNFRKYSYDNSKYNQHFYRWEDCLIKFRDITSYIIFLQSKTLKNDTIKKETLNHGYIMNHVINV